MKLNTPIMANEYGTDEEFRVYKIVGNGNLGAFDYSYALVFERAFENYNNAETWIKDEGDRQVDYTIVHTFRNK